MNTYIFYTGLHIVAADVAACVVVAHNPPVPAGKVSYFKQRVTVAETLAGALLAQRCFTVETKSPFGLHLRGFQQVIIKKVTFRK